MKLVNKMLVVVKCAILSVVIVVGGSIAAQQAFAGGIAEGNANPVEYCEVATSMISQVLATADKEKHEDIVLSGLAPYAGVWNSGLIQVTIIGAAFAPMIEIFEGTPMYELQKKQITDADICVKQIELHAAVNGYDLAEGYPGPTGSELEAMSMLVNLEI